MSSAYLAPAMTAPRTPGPRGHVPEEHLALYRRLRRALDAVTSTANDLGQHAPVLANECHSAAAKIRARMQELRVPLPETGQ